MRRWRGFGCSDCARTSCGAAGQEVDQAVYRRFLGEMGASGGTTIFFVFFGGGGSSQEDLYGEIIYFNLNHLLKPKIKSWSSTARV